MEKNFDATVRFILKEEGGYTNDSGGPTMMGLTLALMQKLGLDLDHDGKVDAADLKLVTADTVRKVFRDQFWGPVDADVLPSGLDLIACDFAYNAGPPAAKAILGYRDIATYTLLRQTHYWQLRQGNPAKYAKYFDGWIGRTLRAWQRAKELQTSV